MQRRQIGRSGLWVSEICIGCMTFGEPGRGGHPWTLPAAEAAPLLAQAVEAGVDFFDTANVYSDGSSEEILGETLWRLAPRDRIVLATKVFGDVDPHHQGLSRRAILRQVDLSLRRLRTDYIDLYQIHRFDPATPVEETMQALDDLIRAGKVRYIGASTMAAWQFAKLQATARSHGWTPFVSMQNQISLIYREEEREMIPLCLDQGVGLIPWSPIGRGRLARPVGVETARIGSDAYGRMLFAQSKDADAAVIDTVEAVSRETGRSMAQVALAWVRQKPGVAAPIVGYSRPEQFADILAGLNLVLDSDQIARLEAPYVPRLPVTQ